MTGCPVAVCASSSVRLRHGYAMMLLHQSWLWPMHESTTQCGCWAFIATIQFSECCFCFLIEALDHGMKPGSSGHNCALHKHAKVQFTKPRINSFSTLIRVQQCAHIFNKHNCAPRKDACADSVPFWVRHAPPSVDLTCFKGLLMSVHESEAASENTSERCDWHGFLEACSYENL